MDFPIVKLLDEDHSQQWLEQHFHPEGLKCVGCGAARERARWYRRTRRSQVDVYRCLACDRIYNIYSGTVFAHKQLRPSQVVLLVRGFCQGVPTAKLARELGLSRTTVHTLRQQIQAQALHLQPTTPLADTHSETDEMFQNAGEKRRTSR